VIKAEVKHDVNGNIFNCGTDEYLSTIERGQRTRDDYLFISRQIPNETLPPISAQTDVTKRLPSGSCLTHNTAVNAPTSITI
jgi:hypothetical protein